MQVSTNDLYETSVLAKSQNNLQSLLRDANSSKSRRVANVSNVVSGRRLVYCAAVGILLPRGIALLVWLRPRMSTASNTAGNVVGTNTNWQAFEQQSREASISTTEERQEFDVSTYDSVKQHDTTTIVITKQS